MFATHCHICGKSLDDCKCVRVRTVDPATTDLRSDLTKGYAEWQCNCDCVNCVTGHCSQCYYGTPHQPKPPLVVTRNGVVCEDQVAALEEFKRQCIASKQRWDDGGKFTPAEQPVPERPPHLSIMSLEEGRQWRDFALGLEAKLKVRSATVETLPGTCGCHMEIDLIGEFPGYYTDESACRYPEVLRLLCETQRLANLLCWQIEAEGGHGFPVHDHTKALRAILPVPPRD